MSIQLGYIFNDNIFRIGDLVSITHKDIFTNDECTYIGRISNSTLSNEIELDISQLYNSSTISVRLDEIVSIEKI